MPACVARRFTFESGLRFAFSIFYGLLVCARVKSVAVFLTGLTPELGRAFDATFMESYFLNACFAGEIGYLRTSVELIFSYA